jgi:hypothetical protein
VVECCLDLPVKDDKLKPVLDDDREPRAFEGGGGNEGPQGAFDESPVSTIESGRGEVYLCPAITSGDIVVAAVRGVLYCAGDEVSAGDIVALLDAPDGGLVSVRFGEYGGGGDPAGGSALPYDQDKRLLRTINSAEYIPSEAICRRGGATDVLDCLDCDIPPGPGTGPHSLGL